MHQAVASVNACFGAWFFGGCTKAEVFTGLLLKAAPSPSLLPFYRGKCTEASALRVGSGGDSDVFVKGNWDKNVAEAVKNILEMVNRASSRRKIFHTDFLTPLTLNESISAIEKLANIKAVAQGGYPQAERCRLSIGNPELLTTVPDVVAALSIFGNFGFEHCSHGDFLGSIIGSGIAREKIGDILLQGNEGAHVLVVPELVEFLKSALVKVGNVPVTCEQIPLLALKYELPKTKSFTAVEASLRVDALASAGFKISRSKLVSLIRKRQRSGLDQLPVSLEERQLETDNTLLKPATYRKRQPSVLDQLHVSLRGRQLGTDITLLKPATYSNGEVRLNWSPVMKNGTILKTGDVVSISGLGRLKIGKINHTRKGKFAVELIQYL